MEKLGILRVRAVYVSITNAPKDFNRGCAQRLKVRNFISGAKINWWMVPARKFDDAVWRKKKFHNKAPSDKQSRNPAERQLYSEIPKFQSVCFFIINNNHFLVVFPSKDVSMFRFLRGLTPNSIFCSNAVQSMRERGGCFGRYFVFNLCQVQL